MHTDMRYMPLPRMQYVSFEVPLAKRRTTYDVYTSETLSERSRICPLRAKRALREWRTVVEWPLDARMKVARS